MRVVCRIYQRSEYISILKVFAAVFEANAANAQVTYEAFLLLALIVLIGSSR
jgi:hypothetical protein